MRSSFQASREMQAQPHLDRIAIDPWTQGWLAWARGAEGLLENARWLIGRHLAEVERLRREIRVVEARLRSWAEGDAHRRTDYSGTGPQRGWLTSNFQRYGYDFVPVDERGELR